MNQPQIFEESEHQELFLGAIRPQLALHIPSALGPLGYYVFLRVRAGTTFHGTIHVRLTGLNCTDVTHRVHEPERLPARDGHEWLNLGRLPLARGDGQLTLTGPLPDGELLLCTWPRFVTSGQADDWLDSQRDPLWAPSGVPLGGIGTGRVDICRDGRFRNFSGNNNQDMPFEDPAGLGGLLVAGQPFRPDDFSPAFPQARLRQGDISILLSGPLTPHDLKTSSLPAVLIRSESGHAIDLQWPNLVGAGGGVGRAEGRTGYGDGSYRYWPPPDQPRITEFVMDDIAVCEYTNAASPVCRSADGAHYVARRGRDLVLVWAMPHATDSLGVERGLHWQNYFADGREIIRYVVANFDTILAGAGALEALLRETDLPEWMWRRLLNCCYPLVTNSVFYRDGRFSINEGPTEMSGVYGTIDQRLAAHPATLLFFPELNKRELRQFAATMTANGEINHDLGAGHLESKQAGQQWPDIQCSFVIQCARHQWLTGVEVVPWPTLRLALERHGQWADAGDGVAQLGHATGLGTSYDSYNYEGTTAYIGTLWIAALLVGRKLAREHNDAEFAGQCDRWIVAAQRKLDTDLWNGRFYRAFPGNENCHAGMLAGELYARLLTGEDVLPRERLRACANALLELHGSDRFAVPPDEVAADGSGGSLYGWLPYIEAFCLAPCALLGHPRALPVWQRVVEALQHFPCDTRLMYRPQTGAPSWGAYYMTAPASWLVYEALHEQLHGRYAVIHPKFWAIGQKIRRRFD
ncbi:MAG: hypothetical protein PCFJNLEI_02131 [Verrucomicrobiae bacterium]|nr:hypothetical protein [Verrucomicrobiae bacterium]